MEGDMQNPGISTPSAFHDLPICTCQGCRKFVLLFCNCHVHAIMESFGVIASGISVVEASMKTASSLTRLHANYKDAPKQASRLQGERLHHVQNQALLNDLPTQLKNKLSGPIKSANDIEATLPADFSVTKKRDRIRWAVCEKNKAEEAIAGLQNIQSSTSFTLVAETSQTL